MRVSELLDKVRYNLSDTETNDADRRWSNARLLSLLNDSLEDMAIKTNLFETVKVIKLYDNVHTYSLGDKGLKIKRLEHLNLPMKLVSHSELDRLQYNTTAFFNSRGINVSNDYTVDGYYVRTSAGDTNSYHWSWAEHKGNIFAHAIIDLNNPGVFRIYPIPENVNRATETYSSTDGAVVGIDFSGVDSHIFNNDIEIADADLGKYVRVYYTKFIEKYSSVDDDLDEAISRLYFSLLADYITYKAYLDNHEGSSIQKSSLFYTMYTDKLAIFKEQKSENFVRKSYEIPYTPIGS